MFQRSSARSLAFSSPMLFSPVVCRPMSTKARRRRKRDRKSHRGAVRTFYPTLAAMSGTQITAQTASGAPSAFTVNAVYHLTSPQTGFNGRITQLTPFFGQVYGDFGAGDNVTPQGSSQTNSSQSSSILGQAVIPGTSGGYVVAANGASPRRLGKLLTLTFLRLLRQMVRKERKMLPHAAPASSSALPPRF